MNLTLDGLKPGEFREIRPEEWQELTQMLKNSSNETITGGQYETALQQMKELVKKLNKAAKAYYQEDREIMDNREYIDALYDQLVKMEQETGIVLADSPTVNVGYACRFSSKRNS